MSAEALGPVHARKETERPTVAVRRYLQSRRVSQEYCLDLNGRGMRRVRTRDIFYSP